MRDWNVVVTVRPGHYRDVRRALEPYGKVGRTRFRGVLTLCAEHPEHVAEALREAVERDPTLRDRIARAIPCEYAFEFHTVDEFEDHMDRIARALASELGGTRFHVRVHRRGFEGELHADVEERRIGETALESLQEVGTPAVVAFDDADVVVDVEIVGTRAGVAVVKGPDEEGFPFG